MLIIRLIWLELKITPYRAQRTSLPAQLCRQDTHQLKFASQIDRESISSVGNKRTVILDDFMGGCQEDVAILQ